MRGGAVASCCWMPCTSRCCPLWLTPLSITALSFSVHTVLQVLSCRGCSFLSLLSNNITKFPDDFGIFFPNLKCPTPLLPLKCGAHSLQVSRFQLQPRHTLAHKPLPVPSRNNQRYFFTQFQKQSLKPQVYHTVKGQGTALVGPSADLVALGHVSRAAAAAASPPPLSCAASCNIPSMQVPSLFRYLKEIQKGMTRGIIR
jgi:hypothetical protein